MDRHLRNDATNESRFRARRHFFQDCGLGIGKIALASMLAEATASAAGAEAPPMVRPTAPKPPHFPAKVKRVIYLFMAGAPSQLEMFDYKEKLVELEGQPIPPSVIAGRFSAMQSANSFTTNESASVVSMLGAYISPER